MAGTDLVSPLSIVPPPTIEQLARERRVDYVVVSSRQDDELWGPIGALWLSADGERGGFLVHPLAIWAGSEFVRSYRSALDRGWTPASIYEYWQREVWPGGCSVSDEHRAESLMLLNDLIAAI